MKVIKSNSASEDWKKISESSGSVFLSESWLGAYSEKLVRYLIVNQGGQPVAAFVAENMTVRKMKVLANPGFMPHCALFILKNQSNTAQWVKAQKDVIRTFADWINTHPMVMISTPPEIVDLQPVMWEGLEVKPKYTYRIDLRLSEDELLEKMAPKTRNTLRKMELPSNNLKRLTDKERLIEIITNQLGERAVKYNSELLEHIVHNLDSQNSYAFSVEENGSIAAFSFCIHDHQTAYYLFGGNSKGGHGSAGSHAVWKAIREAKGRGLSTFDFEGSMIPSIEKFFRGFGGELTPYYSISKIGNLRKSALRLLGFKL